MCTYNEFNLIIYHGGKLRSFSWTSYNGGFTSKQLEYGEDKILSFQLVTLQNNNGYPDNSSIIDLLLGGNFNQDLHC